MADRFYYGGQAVIEGVMIRGRKAVAVAVRRPNGQTLTDCQPLATLYTGRWRKALFVRGVIVLIETLVLGTRALMFSAEVRLEDEKPSERRTENGKLLWPVLAVSMAVAIGVFFLGPLALSRALGIHSPALSNLVEGAIRLALFLAYLWAVGLTPEIKRVFAYHGAEHMTIAAHEHGSPLQVPEVRRYPKEHPRCGTAFLLSVVIVAVVVFALVAIPRPPLWLTVLSRVALLPVIAGISYEVIRFNAAHEKSPIGRLAIAPGLWLQLLTTRKPDDGQIEVAIEAMGAALTADGAVPAGGGAVAVDR